MSNLTPSATEAQARSFFSAALARHARKFGAEVYLTSDLAERDFLAWVGKWHNHERFSERFPIEGPETARFYLATTDLAFRKTLREGQKKVRPC